MQYPPPLRTDLVVLVQRRTEQSLLPLALVQHSTGTLELFLGYSESAPELHTARFSVLPHVAIFTPMLYEVQSHVILCPSTIFCAAVIAKHCDGGQLVIASSSSSSVLWRVEASVKESNCHLLCLCKNVRKQK